MTTPVLADSVTPFIKGDKMKDMNTNKLQELRKQIDVLDEELFCVLAQRFSTVTEVRKIKKVIGLAPLDEKRWESVVESRLAQAKALGLPAEFTKKLLELIHDRSLEIEG